LAKSKLFPDELIVVHESVMLMHKTC